MALLLLGIFYLKFYYSPPTPSEEIAKEIAVEISGEVRNPGIYLFRNPPILKEVIGRAGGLKETVIFDAIQSSEVLETGTLLTVVKESSGISESPPHPLPLPHGERGQGEGLFLKGGDEGIKQDIIKIKIGRMEANKLLLFSIPLDLNRSSVEDFCLVPGIGESLAHEIVAYRERRKGFRSVEELKDVKGMGNKKYQSIKNFFIVK